jgi:hypothetical protein
MAELVVNVDNAKCINIHFIISIDIAAIRIMP